MKTKKNRNQRYVQLYDGTYPYVLRRSRRAKHILLHVDVSGEIEVVVPWHAAYHEAEQFVLLKRKWIQRVLDKHKRTRERMPVRSFKTGSVIPFFDERFELHVKVDGKRKRTHFTEQDDKLIVHVAHPDDIRRVVGRWMHRKSADFFEECSHTYANQLGKKVREVRVRNMKTQWGSCNKRRGILTYNWRLCLAPLDIARYVVAHEVAHLKVSNHGPSFWRTVHVLDPMYEKSRQWLVQHGHTLTL